MRAIMGSVGWLLGTIAVETGLADLVDGFLDYTHPEPPPEPPKNDAIEKILSAAPIILEALKAGTCRDDFPFPVQAAMPVPPVPTEPPAVVSTPTTFAITVSNRYLSNPNEYMVTAVLGDDVRGEMVTGNDKLAELIEEVGRTLRVGPEAVLGMFPKPGCTACDGETAEPPAA